MIRTADDFQDFVKSIYKKGGGYENSASVGNLEYITLREMKEGKEGAIFHKIVLSINTQRIAASVFHFRKEDSLVNTKFFTVIFQYSNCKPFCE